ncbi:MAG: MFS transporter [Mariprofundaceae bacterium]|nr:MFS transporter [Mariprofundaceae bacterium]
MVSVSSLHHIRLFYAAYFAAMGIVLPFFPVYLAGRGLNVAAIGVFTGLLSVAKVLAPPIAGRALDKSRNPGYFILFASLAAAALALLFPWADANWMLALLVLAFGCLWAAVLPLTDGLSVAVSEAALMDYGRLRVWGSIGFVAASLLGGLWLADTQATNFPYWLAGLMLLAALSARGFPDRSKSIENTDKYREESHRALAWLLLVGFLMQASHGAYYGFFSLYLLQAGYAGWQIGAFWVLGVLAEIVLMWRFSRSVAAIAPAWMLSCCLLLAALRWLGIALTTELIWLILLQLLHAASFAAFHINAVTWVQRLAPAHRRTSAQGWYSAAGFGLGTALGIMGCGWIATRHDGMADFSSAFAVCAAVALCGLLAAWQLPHRTDRKCV